MLRRRASADTGAPADATRSRCAFVDSTLGLAAAGLAAESVNEAIEERIVQPAARRLTAIARNTKCEARIAEAACYVFLEGLA